MFGILYVGRVEQLCSEGHSSVPCPLAVSRYPGHGSRIGRASLVLRCPTRTEAEQMEDLAEAWQQLAPKQSETE